MILFLKVSSLVLEVFKHYGRKRLCVFCDEMCNRVKKKFKTQDRKRVNEPKSLAPNATPPLSYAGQGRAGQITPPSDPATGELVEHFLIQRLILVFCSCGQENIATDKLVHHLTVHLGAGE